MESTDFFERVTRGDTVDKEETLPCAHVLFPHGAKKYPRSVIAKVP